ncbi:MAG: biopolymer transporter ExbD [Holophagaceae bacterium]|nr:biopolymer transporter ExbD [Holophagaceae bacterium]
MGMDVGSKGGVKADINVTPLVDIVLVLLIIFIVITPAVNDAVALPPSKQSIKQDMDPSAKYLSLILTRSQQRDPDTQLYTMGFVLVDDRDAKDARGNPLTFRFDNLEERDKLLGYVKKNIDLLSDKRIFIKADSELPYGYVNELFQICREAGADEANVVTAEDKSGKDKT